MRWSSWVLGLALGIAASGAALAQGLQFGNLVGTLTLEDGRPAAGVEVTVTSPAQQGERSTVSQANGDYLLRGLPPGEYVVRFALSGLRPEEKTATIPLGGTVRTDARLSPEEVREQVVVTGEAGSVLVTPTVGDNFTAEEVDTLPISRDLIEVAKLSPGVTDTPTPGQITISGGLSYDNLLLLDGADIKDNTFGDLDRLFIEDAIEETQVLTGAISAEYGRFTGGVINAITKSGGNDFKGSLRSDLTNPSWREKTPLEERRGTALTGSTQETYSATLGGYVLKDKLWFFTAGRRFSVDTQRTLALTGIPYTDENEDQRFEGKLTWRLAEGHSLQASYLDQDTKLLQPSLSSGSTLDTLSHKELPSAVQSLRYTGVLGAAAFVTAQYSEKDSELKSGDMASRDLRDSPILCVHFNCLYNGPYFDATDPEHRDNQQSSASLSYFLDTARLGSHNLKLGGERFTDVRTGGSSQSSTDYSFMTDPLLDAEGNLILDAEGHAIPVFTPGFDFDTTAVFWEAIRGARLKVGNDALYVNDDWKLNSHWAFNLGARYDKTKDQNTERLPLVDTDRVSPRLALSFDPRGNGKYRFDATYAEYTGSYNLQLWASPTGTGNPGYLYGPYLGPPGQGRDFAPGFDPNNYVPLFVGSPRKATSIAPGTHSPVTDEYTLSAGMQLSRSGFLRLTFQNRRAHDLIEDYTEFGLGTVEVEVGGVTALADRKIFRNSDLDARRYRALLLEGRYQIRSGWSVDGNWTHQIRNQGNYEGEGPSVIGPDSLGDFPELFDERNFPSGRLDDFRADTIHLWTVYTRNLGAAGDLTLSLLGNYFSPRTYSLMATGVSLTPQQLARDPGYAQLPFVQRLFFGERGSEELASWYTFDTAATYGLPFWKRLTPWVKLEVRNLLDDDTLIGWNTAIVPITRNPDGSRAPVDALGRPTTFRRGPLFGQPRTSSDYPAPREYRFSLGIRF